MEKSMTDRRAGCRRAFTLVELMVVIAIIGLLAMLAVPNFIGNLRNSQRARCCANMVDIRNATYAYLADHANEPVPTLSSDFITTTLPKYGYLRAVPECPGGGKYSYQGGIEDTLRFWQGTGAVSVSCSYGTAAGHSLPMDAAN